MADLANYQDKLLQDQNQNGAQAQGASGTGEVSGGGVVGTGPTSNNAGVGAGGTGAWTNIQAYLDANKQDAGSSNVLNNAATSVYDSEKSKLDSAATQTKTQADSEASKISDAKDNAKPWVEKAAGAYDWSGNHGQDYTDNVGKLQNAAFGQYQGPKNFSYGTSADFQKYNSDLANDPAFYQMMNDQYRKQAGGALSQGQQDLQTQFMTSNEPLAQTRSNLLNKFAGFGDYQNQVVGDTDKAIQTAQGNYSKNQNALMDYLSGLGNEEQSKINQAENDARNNYNTEFNTTDSGRGGINNWYDSNAKGPGGIFVPLNDNSGMQNLNMLRNQGLIGRNLTYRQLQDELNMGDILGGKFTKNLMTGDPVYAPSDIAAGNSSSLNNFYNQEVSKYANTGDADKRQWNTIMDILRNNSRKSQGFNVRS